MENRFLLILLVSVLFSLNVDSQCLSQGITLSTQTQLNNFKNDYPGCTEILGNLTITDNGNDPIVNFNGLSHIEIIRGDLRIESNFHILNARGFDNLNKISGDLFINLQETKTFDFFNALVEARGIHISACNALTSLSGFNKLSTIENSLYINASYKIEDISGFKNLKTVGKNFSLVFNKIEQISGFESLKEVKGTYRLESISTKELTGFNNLSSVGNFSIFSLLSLQKIDGFQKLKLVDTSDFAIEYCRSMKSMGNILANSNTLGSLTINGCDSLSKISNSKLNYIKGGLTITNNPKIIDLSSLSLLDSVGGIVSLSAMQVENLDALSNLKSTGGLYIYIMPKLISIEKLTSLTKINGSLVIYGNNSLGNLTGLENVNPQYLKSQGQYKKLHVTSNSKLSICNSVCQLIALDEIHKSIFDNAPGCKDSRQAWVNCGLHKCYSGGVDFVDQASIDQFIQNNKYCEVIDGPVCIGNCNQNYVQGAITNIKGLDKLDSIFGKLTLKNLPSIELSQFSRLKTVAGSLEATDNSNINFNGFYSAFSGSLVLRNNNIIGFPSFYKKAKSIGGHFIFDNNTGLTSMPSFDELLSINGDVQIINNPDFLNFPSFGKKVRIYGSVNVSNNDKINGINAVSSPIVYIGGNLIFNNNAKASRLYIATDSIIGSLEVMNNEMTDYFGSTNPLRFINGSFKLINNPKLQISSLDSLRFVNGNFIIQNCDKLISLSSVRYFDKINGYIDISENDALTSLEGLHTLKIETIQSKEAQKPDVTIMNNPKLNDCDFWNFCDILKLPNFDMVVSGNLGKCSTVETLTEDCKIIECPSFTIINYQRQIDEFDRYFYGCNYIEDDLKISTGGSDIIVNLKGLKQLRYVKGSITLNGSYITNLEGLENISYVGQSIDLWSNVKMNSFFGMPKLDSLNKLSINDGNVELKNFNSMASLQYLGNLNIFSANIENFKGLEQVKEINSITSTFAHSLANLSGLGHLRGIAKLRLASNDNLTSIREIDNVPVLNKASLQLITNPKLSLCNTRYVCKFFNNTTTTKSIFNNALGCKSIADIQCDNYLAFGEVFYDTNQNKIKDANEYGIPNQHIMIEGMPEVVVTDEFGRYRIFCDSGTTYTVKLIEYEDWSLTTDTDTYTFQFDPLTNLTSTYIFGLYPKVASHDFIVNASSGPARCSETAKFINSYTNTGAFVESGIVKIYYSNLLNYASSIPLPVSHDSINHVLIFDYQSMQPYQRNTIEIVFKIPGFEFNSKPIGTTASVFRINESGISEDVAETTYTTLIRCAIDPNDKHVNPLGFDGDHLTLIGDKELNYNIRFQNTGTDYAANIRIVDTLSESLDLSTFRLIGSSHEVNVSIVGNVVTFLFDRINLPDSTTNEKESHGYINFAIREKGGLADNTRIENKAHIYFDFNPPIVTNTTFNTMVYNIAVGTSEVERQENLVLYPNPASNEVYIKLDDRSILKAEVYNAQGKYCKSIVDHKILSTKDLQDGLYFIKVYYMDGHNVIAKIGKVVVHH